MSLRFALVTVAVFCIGAYLRLSHLGEVPRSLYWDEVAILIDARSIAATGADMHGNSWLQALFLSYGDYKLPVYVWLSALFGLFTHSDMIVRLPNIFLGIISLPLTAFLAVKLTQQTNSTDKKYLFFAVLLIYACSPWAILFSRTGFEAFASQFFVTASMLLLAYSEKKPKLLIAVPLLGIIATYTYFATRFVWPVLFVVFWLLYKQYTKASFAVALGILVIFAVGLVPMYRSQYYAASQQFRLSTPSVLDPTQRVLTSNLYKESLNNSLISRVLFHRHFLLARDFARNIGDHLTFDYLFLTSQTDNFRHSTKQHGLFLWTVAPFFLIGIWSLLNKNPKLAVFLFVWWATALVPASVPTTTPHALRSLNALTPLVILIGQGLATALVFFARKQFAQFTQGIIVLALLIHTGAFFWHYTRIYPTQSAKDWQEHAHILAQETIKNRVGKEPLTVQKNDGILYLWFLAYGGYSPKEIQSFAKNEYHQLSEFDGIRFE